MDISRTVETLAILLLDAAAKGTVLLVLAWIATVLLRRSSAALRHSVWSLTMLSLVLLPVASWTLPSWRLPILPMVEPVELAADGESVAAADSVATPFAQLDEGAVPMGSMARAPELNSPPPQFAVGESPENHESQATATSAATFVVAERPTEPALQPAAVGVFAPIDSTSLMIVLIWGPGVALFGVAIAVGVCRALSFHRRSQPVLDGAWCRLLKELSQRLRLRRKVKLREHAEPILPLTWGVIRPVVLLPRRARKWDESIQQAVLLHELAHVQRRDVAWQLVGRIACTLYWFHPLAWYGLRQLRQERELACDDAVVRSGKKASDYAEQLLQVARLCSAPRGPSLGVAMAEGHSLETRVKSLFDTARSHGPLRRAVAFALLLVCGLTLGTVAIVHPVSATASAAQAQNGNETTVNAAEFTTTKTASPANQVFPRQWSSGAEVLERIVKREPAFGPAKRGVRLGVAYATPQRKYSIGERIRRLCLEFLRHRPHSRARQRT